LQAGFWKGDGADFRLVPLVHAAGANREFAFASRLVVDRELERVRVVAIQGDDLVGAGLFHIHRVVAPFPIRCAADVELIGRRNHHVLVVIKIRGILGVGKVNAFVLAKIPMVGSGVRPLMVLLLVEHAAEHIDLIGVVILESGACRRREGAFGPVGMGLLRIDNGPVQT